MKRILHIGILVFVFGTLSSCLKDYQELNTDPELLGITDPRNVFTGATENFNNSSRAHLMNKYSGAMQAMQYTVYYNGAQSSVYYDPSENSRPSIYTPYYGDYYTQIGLRLRYLVNTVIPAADNSERYQNLAAVATILETYEAWLMFDVNGAAPYNEAFKLATEGISKPRYDLYQEDLNGDPLYKVFDAKIKENVAILMSGLANQYELGNNDYFYKGNIDYWIKFGNTLRIKMAQRLEVADNSFYTQTISDVFSNTGGIISSNDESCVYNHPNEYNNNTDDTQILTYQYCASRALVNFLKEYDDPRLPLLVRRNGFGDGNNNTTNDDVATLLAQYFPNYETDYPEFAGRYWGMSANPDSTSTAWSRSAYYTFDYTNSSGVASTMTVRQNSQIESRFYIKNGGKIGTQITTRDKEDATYDVSQESISLFTPLITYPEVCFMMAEIAYKSGSAMGGKTALVWFQDGIRASMEQYQKWAEKMGVPSAMNSASDNYNPITTAKIDAYLSKSEFQTVTLEKIISQQWINLYMRPEEMWATWKRTGLPAFKDDPTPVDGEAYFETIAKGGSNLTIVRRAALPTPNTENIDNYNTAVEKLTQSSGYGTLVGHTEGRIWWDRN